MSDVADGPAEEDERRPRGRRAQPPDELGHGRDELLGARRRRRGGWARRAGAAALARPAVERDRSLSAQAEAHVVTAPSGLERLWAEAVVDGDVGPGRPGAGSRSPGTTTRGHLQRERLVDASTACRARARSRRSREPARRSARRSADASAAAAPERRALRRWAGAVERAPDPAEHLLTRRAHGLPPLAERLSATPGSVRDAPRRPGGRAASGRGRRGRGARERPRRPLRAPYARRSRRRGRAR